MKIMFAILKIVLIGFVLIIGMYIYSYFIGSVASVHTIGIGYIEVSDKNITFELGILGSITDYKDYSYRIINDNLYIKVYNVLASKWYPMKDVKINIDGDFSRIQGVYLEDYVKQKRIWSHE